MAERQSGPEVDRRSNFDDARIASTERMDFMHAVMQIQREHYMLFGDFPSAEQVAEKMGLIAKSGGV